MGRTASSVPPLVPAPESGRRMTSAIVGGLDESVGRRTVSSVPPPVPAPGRGRVVASAVVPKVEGVSVRRVVGPSAPPCVLTPMSTVPALAPKVEDKIGALEESVGCMAAALSPPPPPSTPTPTPAPMPTTTTTPTPTPTGGVQLKVENEGGDLYVSPYSAIHPLLTAHRTFPLPKGKIQASTVDVNIRNKDGRMRFEQPVASSWKTGLVATLLVTAGTAYWYRNELRIIGRGIMAGANLAIERWEKKREGKEKEKEIIERSESVGWPPAHTNANNNIGVQCPGYKTTFGTRTEYNGHRLTNSCPVLDTWRRERALQSQQAQEVSAAFHQLEAQGQARNLRSPRPTLNPRTNECTAAADAVWRKTHTNEAAEQMTMGDTVTMHDLEGRSENGEAKGGVQLTPESSDAYEGDAEN
jgi:hypothetical protein